MFLILFGTPRPTPGCITESAEETLYEIEAEKFLTESFVREKENGQIKGLISHIYVADS